MLVAMVLSSVVGGEGQERDRASALDRQLHGALVFRANAGDAARYDLAALGHEVAQTLRVFVVDRLGVVRAEGATTTTTAGAEPDVVFVAHAVESAVIATAAAIQITSLLSHCASSSSEAGPSTSPKSSSGSRASRWRSRSGESTKPSWRSIDSSGSSSAGGSTASNLRFSVLTSNAPRSTSLRTSTGWYLSTSSSKPRLRSNSLTSAPPPTYVT